MRRLPGMLRLRHLPPQFLTMTALVAAAASLVFAGWILYDAVKDARGAHALVAKSEDVLQVLGDLREDYAEITAAQRGYLLGGSPAMLEERDRAVARALEASRRLQALTRGDAAQHARALRMHQLLQQRSELTRILAARVPKPVLPLPFTPAEVDRIREIQRDFNLAADGLEAEESRLLAGRQQVELARVHHTALLLLAAFGTFALMVLLAFGGVMIESRRRQRLERQMVEVVDKLPVTIWQMRSAPDGQRRFIYVADSAPRERGLRPEDLLRDRSLAMSSVHPDDRERVAGALQHSERTLEPLDCSYRLASSRDGKPHWVHTHAGMRRLKDGSLLWTGYWADITAQKDMEFALREATEEARRASRAKSTFLATMSHEIRTPMTAVMGLLELLDLTELDQEQRATLSVIRESSQSLLRIIDDILDFSKVEEGRLALAPVPASLRTAVRRACEVHGGAASARGLLLEQWIDPRIGAAHLFDPLRLGQILHNFLSNAIKFTEQGRVQVMLEQREARGNSQRVRLSVTDTGIGVPPDRIAQLFQPFEQGAPQISSTYGGTGLGLAICRRLAELMGGTVDMQSTPGAGTRVVFEASFPLVDPAVVQDHGPRKTGQRLEAAIAGLREAPSPEAAEAEGTLVLVVDDHPTNRLVLSRQVATLGYAVLVAEDGAEALHLWQSRRIGLLLTDSNMPHMNGYELARAIREEEARQGRGRMPILACTANASPGEAERCEAAGMDGCLVKPLALATLLEQMQRWLPLPGMEGVTEPPQFAPEAQDSKFDSSLVAMVSGGEGEEERRLFEGFLRTNASDLAALRSAVETHDTAEVARLAHRVRGAAQTLGALALLRACHELEENALVEEPRSTLMLNLDDVLARSAELEQRLRSRMAALRAPVRRNP